MRSLNYLFNEIQEEKKIVITKPNKAVTIVLPGGCKLYRLPLATRSNKS